MDRWQPPSGVALRPEIVVIGAGQGGLSSAYYLKRRGLASIRGFVVLDRSPSPGGAWQYRWPSLTLSTVNRIHDLPGLPFSEVVDTATTEAQASVAVPECFAAYEKAFELPVSLGRGADDARTNVVRKDGTRLRARVNSPRVANP